MMFLIFNFKIKDSFWQLFNASYFIDINYSIGLFANKYFSLDLYNSLSYNVSKNFQNFFDSSIYFFMGNSLHNYQNGYNMDIEQVEYFDSANSGFESSAFYWSLFTLDSLYKYSILFDNLVLSQFDNFWTNYLNYINLSYSSEVSCCIVIERKSNYFLLLCLIV